MAQALSQVALAELAGMKSSQLSRYEAGHMVPRERVLFDLAAALGVRPEWLLNGTGPRTTSRDVQAVPRPLRVATSALPAGGTEISLVLYDDLRTVFMERAQRQGLTLDAFIRNALLELAKEPVDEKLELAREIKALIDAGAV